MVGLERILVGYDGREGGREALALARDLAGGDAGRLVVVCAFPSLAVHDAVPSRRDGLLESDAERALADARDQLGPDAGAELLAVIGTRPALSLQDMARERAADLIVIGSSRRSAVGRVLGGDLLAGLLETPLCPVCVAPRGRSGPARMGGSASPSTARPSPTPRWRSPPGSWGRTAGPTSSPASRSSSSRAPAAPQRLRRSRPRTRPARS